MLIQHQVKDFAAWKKVFDSSADLRTSNGEISAQVFRDASDPDYQAILKTFEPVAATMREKPREDMPGAVAVGSVNRSAP